MDEFARILARLRNAAAAFLLVMRMPLDDLYEDDTGVQPVRRRRPFDEWGQPVTDEQGRQIRCTGGKLWAAEDQEDDD